MCGIFCCFSKLTKRHHCLGNELKQSLQKRGPNSMSILEIDNAIMAGFVLWHQGSNICSQPMESNSHVLLFNGDVFNMEAGGVHGISDTEWIFHKLSLSKSEDELIKCFRTIEGPFSLIYYDKVQRNLYFARDSLGRNSLLLENDQNHLRILSTSHIYSENDITTEISPLGIYKISTDDFDNCIVFPWLRPEEYWKNQANILEGISGIRIRFAEYAIEPSWLVVPITSEKFSFNFYDYDGVTYPSAKELYENLLKNHELTGALNNFSKLLENSVKQRVQLTTDFCAKCSPTSLSCDHSKIAILFSGGVDCSILALLADKFVKDTDSIDLINVSFEATNSEFITWNVPDRESAQCSFDNLKELRPYRKWNFIEVNVTRKRLYYELANDIKHLIYPLNTVLDESIGCAFWFASQGKGLLYQEEFESSAKVVIIGSGADELFGGYMRHKNAYIRCNGTDVEKQKCLLAELEKDWQRIPSRNLARDDRVISDSGKTPRAPFIEENVVKFARSLKPNQRCCFLYQDGVGDKLFLRLYGFKLGLTAAFLKKRAIQFGSKIANKKENANDRSKYL